MRALKGPYWDLASALLGAVWSGCRGRGPNLTLHTHTHCHCIQGTFLQERARGNQATTTVVDWTSAQGLTGGLPNLQGLGRGREDLARAKPGSNPCSRERRFQVRGHEARGTGCPWPFASLALSPVRRGTGTAKA